VVKTINANCLDVLKETAANSQDLIFCDPPYALGSDVIIRKDGKPDYRKAVDFMSKWQQPDGYFWEQWFNEAFRVLRYGGRVVMFGMDRQLMLNKYYACFAGFAEQQSLYWFFISSFPKASDLSKMLDKNAGAEREVVGEKEHWGRQNRSYGGFTENGDITVFDGIKGNELRKGVSEQTITAPATTLAQKYNGMKYSIAPLKQTNETILVFQKPYKTGSCLHDTLAYENGDDTCMCGAVDVEGNRCEAISETDNKSRLVGFKGLKFNSDTYHKSITINQQTDIGNGRYPAQTYCDDEAAKVLDGQSGVQKSNGAFPKETDTEYNNIFRNIKPKNKERIELTDTGGCSRILHRCNYDLNDYDIYMYCPKVSNRERNEGCEALNEKRRATLMQI
jgi:hypothetical protein